MSLKNDLLTVFRLGIVSYEAALHLQNDLAAARAKGDIGDTLLLLQHPPVITIGRAGGQEDLLVSVRYLQERGIALHQTDRGGKATYHGPGQLVAYPILRLPDSDVLAYVRRLEETVISLLADYGLAAQRLEGYPGVWIGDRKIAAIGIAVADGVTRHGLALNVAPNLEHFLLFHPCGIANKGVTSMAMELGYAPPFPQVEERFINTFCTVFGFKPVVQNHAFITGNPSAEFPKSQSPIRHLHPPAVVNSYAPWLVRPAPAPGVTNALENLVQALGLHTVCQEARCPNLAECFSLGMATFLVLGDVCTRGCRFCAVKKGRPLPVDITEPSRVAQAVARLGLKHVVITSVTRDDLPDGGAAHFAACIQAVRKASPGTTVEILIPDFSGSLDALEIVLAARPDILNHNLETVPRLYPIVRPRADYRRSLGLLEWAARHGLVTKSGLMLGLGEAQGEVLAVLRDLRRSGCQMVTLGQYLQPSPEHLPVREYLSPGVFADYERLARSLGFRWVAAAPLVRSSYRAAEALPIAKGYIARG